MLGKVFVNTSVLQYLHSIGLIDILKTLFGKVYITQEVSLEIERGKQQGVNLPNLDESGYIKVIDTNMGNLIDIVRDLGKGEASLILLGMKNPESLVILDDQLAREVARSLNIKITGTVGLLIMAKEKGIIKAVKPYLDNMINTGFYLAPAHRLLILSKVNET